MTVEELREALADWPDDTRVVVRGPEGGLNDLAVLTPRRVVLDYHGPRLGWHEPVQGDEAKYAGEGQIVTAVHLDAR